MHYQGPGEKQTSICGAIFFVALLVSPFVIANTSHPIWKPMFKLFFSVSFFGMILFILWLLGKEESK